MTRFWNEFVALLGDLVPGGVPMLAFLSLLAAALVALGWYFWPAWLPWRWNWRFGSGRAGTRSTRDRHRFRFGSPRWRWRWRLRRRRKRGGEPASVEELPADQLPDLPAEVLRLTADQLAAAGRYKEAVRERLRAIIADLIERGVLPISPGWTVMELAHRARQTRPDLAPPLAHAVAVFSEIWYGLRPATAGDDLAMREDAGAVKQLLAAQFAVGAPGDRHAAGGHTGSPTGSPTKAGAP